MPAYTKSQNFTALRGQDPDPAVFDTEFTLVQTATASLADTTGAAFTGPITVPAGATGTQVPNATDVKNHSFAAGTVMAFFQAAAPTGWQQDVTAGLNDSMIRIVTGAGGVTGGVNGVAAGLVATGGHALVINEMPAHTHNFTAMQAGTGYGAFSNTHAVKTSATTSTGGTGPGTNGVPHTHPITWSPKYVDMILARKM